ncbi:MAG: hypothetical protein HZA24_04875 [Nitrospirae bacterium]|nr:hypothetical protein [Nitrospirota bacterium]
MDLNTLGARIAALSDALNAHRHAWLAGSADALRTAAIHGRHADLLAAPLVAELRARGEAARPWLNAVTRIQIEGGCAPLRDRVMDVLDSEIIRNLNDKWYFRDTPRMIAEECNRKQRKVLDQSQRRVLARLEPVLLEEQEAAHTLMVDRGFTSYQAMCEALSGIDHDTFQHDLDGLLDDSGSVFQKHLGDALREAGVHPDDARTHDIAYLWGGHFGRARRFPELLPTLTATFAALGLDPAMLPGIDLDLGPREGKHPGHHVVAVHSPDHIALHLSADGRWEGWMEALAATGEALARAHAPALPRHAAPLWDGAVVVAYRALFASLPGNPDWLAAHCPKVPVAEQLTLFHLWWLYRLRHLIGNLRYARFLHGPGAMIDKADAFEHTMHQALGVRLERDYYLWDTAPFYDQAVALRGHFLGAQLLDAMIDRHGRAWFADKAAGDWLRGLWRHGGDLAALCAELGVKDPADPWPLTERLEEVLGTFEGE